MKTTLAKNDISWWEGYIAGLKESSLCVPDINQADYKNKLLYAYKRLDKANKELMAVEASAMFNDDLKKIIKD